jgi:hypothetical protein
MGFLKKILKGIFNSSIPLYKFQDNKLYFKIDLEEYFEYELGEYDMKTRHDPFVYEAYTLNNKEIFLEYIRPDANASWNGQPLSLYEGFFKKKLGIRYLDVIENREYPNYVFKTYRVNDSFILHMIYLFTPVSELFVVDVKGNLYKNLQLKLNKNYKYAYENEQKGDINFNISLVKDNSIKGYFNESD